MTDLDLSADYISVSDLTDRVDALRAHDATVELAAKLKDMTEDEIEDLDSDCLEDAEELAKLEAILDELEGAGGDHEWRGHWYPAGLIRDSHFTAAMKELVEDIGDLPQGVPGYLVIDWNATANNLRADYSDIEIAGTTYWFR